MVRVLVLVAGIALVAGCQEDAPRPAPPPLRFWHTFNPVETEALNRHLAATGRDDEVAPTLLPFARGEAILAEALAGSDCPDLIRLDASWLPGLAAADRLRPVPEALARRPYLPEAAALARAGDALVAVPQSLDGLVLLARRARPPSPWPPPDLPALLAAVRAHDPPGLGLRVDGYWFLPFLRAAGGTLLDPDRGQLRVDAPEGRRALAGFAALLGPGGVAPDLSGDRDQARELARRFASGRLAAVLEGPWAVSALSGGDPDRLTAAAFPGSAPRGGAVLAVPRCAARPEAAWGLAAALVDPALQVDWSRRFGAVPTTEEALARSGRLAREIRRALARGKPLPRHPAAASLFDDLTPALEAVVAGDATAEEALAGVRRSWDRRNPPREAP